MRGNMSEIDDKLKASPISITLFPDSTTKQISSVKEFEELLQNEINFWNALPDCEFKRNTLMPRLSSWMNSIKDVYRQTNQNQAFNIIVDVKNQVTSDGSKYIFSASEAAKIILASANGATDNNFIQGLFDYFKELHLQFNLKSRFIAYLNCYVHSTVGEDARHVLDGLGKSHQDLYSKLSNLEADHKKAIETFNDDVKTSKMAAESAVKVNQESFDKLVTKLKEMFDKDMEVWHKEISELKEVYEQRLTLEEPLKAWEKHSTHYWNQGKSFSIAAGIFAVIAVILAICLAFNLPEIFVDPNKFNLNTVKGVFLIITAMSILVFAINICIRFSISAFHLSRDAEERKQLAYQFLAMLKNKSLEAPELKKIVLQSLFSRADTGLLKGNQHIQMPSISNLQDTVSTK